MLCVSPLNTFLWDDITFANKWFLLFKFQSLRLITFDLDDSKTYDHKRDFHVEHVQKFAPR